MFKISQLETIKIPKVLVYLFNKQMRTVKTEIRLHIILSMLFLLKEKMEALRKQTKLLWVTVALPPPTI